MTRPSSFNHARLDIEGAFEVLQETTLRSKQKTDNLLELEFLDLLIAVPDMLAVPVLAERYRSAIYAVVIGIEPNENSTVLELAMLHMPRAQLQIDPGSGVLLGIVHEAIADVKRNSYTGSKTSPTRHGRAWVHAGGQYSESGAV